MSSRPAARLSSSASATWRGLRLRHVDPGQHVRVAAARIDPVDADAPGLEHGSQRLGERVGVIARALAALHERPAEPWTIERLAAEVHLSRATLARRFTELVGEPPLAYLTRWRMDLAARRLKDTTDTVETIARAVGYTSEYAFNRASAAGAASRRAATGARRRSG